MALAKPARRRIVPEQILSPTKSQTDTETLKAAAGPRLELGDLKEHSAVATELLGAGRKVYIDLASYQRSEKEVDWKDLLKERGIKIEKRAPIPQPEGDGGLGNLRGGLSGRGDAINPLAAVIQRLERAVGMGNIDAEDSDDDSLPRVGMVDGPSDTEDENEGSDGGGGGEKPSAAENGDRPAGEGGEPGAQPNPQQQPTNKPSTKREFANDYDYCDDFIDDTEFIDMLEHTDRRKLKFSGFFIARGSIDRLDELVPGAVPDKPTRKRKVDPATAAGGSGAVAVAVAGEGAAAKAGGDGGAAQGGGDEPAKKKKKKADGSAAATGTAAGGSIPKKDIPQYTMPADVAAAIEQLRSVAATVPPPAVPPPGTTEEGQGAKSNRKVLPPVIYNAIKNVEHLFQRDFAVYQANASKIITEKLFEFLEPFSTRENIRTYIRGKQARKSKAKAATVQTLDQLQFLLASTVPPPSAPANDPAADATSDDDFKPKVSQEQAKAVSSGPVNWKTIPAQARRAVYAYIKANLTDGSANLDSSVGQQLIHQVVALFPPGTMDVNGLKAIYTEQRSKEQQQEASKAAAQPSSTAPGSSAPPSAITAGTKATPQKSAGVTTSGAAGGTNSVKPVSNVKAHLQPPTSLAAAAAAAGAAAAAAAAAITPPPSAKPANPVVAVPVVAQPSAQGADGSGFSTDELLATGLSHGADEAALRQILQVASSCGMYQRVVLRTLILAGPSGVGVADMASNAVNLGMETWDPSSATVKNGLSRQTKNEFVAVLAGHKYALKCFPGVVDTKPERLTKQN